MTDPLENPFWIALTTHHARLAIGSGQARRYPADILPIAALAAPTQDAVRDLHDLLAPGEEVYVTGDLPAVRDVVCTSVLPCLQLQFSPDRVPALPDAGPDSPQVGRLGAADAPAMVGLTDVAFPGFFRPRTHLLGSYFGIHAGDGTLVAMAGERAVLPGRREISAVCTHPEHTGKGLATLLIRHLLRAHAADHVESFLHVAATNLRAIRLYRDLGFAVCREINFNRLRRS